MQILESPSFLKEERVNLRRKIYRKTKFPSNNGSLRLASMVAKKAIVRRVICGGRNANIAPS